MALLLNSPYSYFTDTNGNPLNGGKVYTYAAGTTTPQNTYTDSTGTVAASNPIVLDSSGRAAIWGSGNYKIVVKDSSGVTLYTTDNVALSSGTGDMNKSVYDAANIQEQLVGLTAVQTLTNKTLTSPTINSPTIATPTGVTYALNRQATTSDVNNSTTETAIYSYSVAGGTLGTTGSLLLSLTGDYLNNTGAGSTLTINIKYGATTIGAYSLGSQAQSANRRSIEIDCVLSAANATGAQMARSRVSVGATGTATGTGAAMSLIYDAVHNSIAEDSTAAKTLQVTVTHGTVSASISCRALNVTLLKL